VQATDHPGRPVRPTALLALAAAGLLVLLVLGGVAAHSGPYATELPPAPTSSAAPAAPTTAPAQSAAPPSTAAPTTPPEPVNPITGRIVLVLVLALAGVGLVLLIRLAVLNRPELRRRPPAPVAGSAAGSGSTTVLPDAVDQALLTVEQPDAREAVVRAWLLLGDAAAAAGTPARPAETAAEYAVRLAAAHGLPTASVHRLAELYREARFSGHPVGADQRNEARAELTTLRAALSHPAPTGTSR
jgi:Domain of unknown function (DUF4129)